MKKLILFGCGDLGQLAHFYFSTDSSYEVAGFTVDSAFVPPGACFCGLPVIPFEGVGAVFPPEEYLMFVALSYRQVNEFRSGKVAEAEAKGYKLATYVSSRATVLSREPIGDNCLILEDNTVQPFAKIGRNVTLWSGNHIGHHSEIGDGCFITSHVVISGGVKIGPKCFLGVNATVRDHVSVGASCVIGAGSLIMEDAAPGSVYTARAAELSPVPSRRLRGF
jgi:sugar O-acyltransferase (sialic acid O-acetyltransferase NeuD family)